MSYPPNITVFPQQPPQIFPPPPPQIFQTVAPQPPQSPVIIPIPYNNTPPQPPSCQTNPYPYPQHPMGMGMGGMGMGMGGCPPMMPICPPMMPMCPPPPCRGRSRRSRRSRSKKRCPPGTRKVCTKHGSRMRCKCVGTSPCPPNRHRSPSYRNRCIPNTCPAGSVRNSLGECGCPPNRHRSPSYQNRCIPNTCPSGYRRNSIGECIRPPLPPPSSCKRGLIWSPRFRKCVKKRCPWGLPHKPDGTCEPCPPGKTFTRYGCETIYQPPRGKIHIHGPGCRFGHACGHGKGGRKSLLMSRGKGHHGRGSKGRGSAGRGGGKRGGGMGRHRSDSFLEVPNIKGLGPGVVENFEHDQPQSPNYKFLAIIIVLIIIGVFIYVMRQQNL